MRTHALLALALLLSPAALRAQTLEYYFPGSPQFDPAVPTPAQFLGYEIGTHHTRHDRIVAYMQELARVSPRATYREIGRTYEHRVMPVLTVTSPANHANLEQIRLQHLAASRPGSLATASEGVAVPAASTADRKVIVHLGYGVHGNETSSSEAAMLTAYWLVAGRSPEVQQFLDRGVYHIEPVLNPDGRDRHTHWANMHKAQPFVADPLDREHNEVWPGGRTNHYWFDLNRDWLPLENPESRARIEFHHSWKPNVVTDFHEMGTNATYFFEPSKPVGSWNPLLPERLYTDITLDFAQGWAAALDSVGALYFTKEVYDNSYPGYGSTYPNFLGGLGLVFEQASARGHIQNSSRQGGGVLTFPYAIRNHVRTGMSTVRSAVQYREKLLAYQREFFETALQEAARFPVRAYVWGDPHDPSRNRAFLDLLLRHRIDVYEVPSRITMGTDTFAPGRAWIVPTSQPNYRMVRSIFEPTREFADSVFYDASTWTLSLAYGMPQAEVRSGRPALGELVRDLPEPVVGATPRATYAYLLDWSDYQAPRALYHLVSNGAHAEAAFQPFTARTNEGERRYVRGSISVPVQVQGISADSLHALVQSASRHAGVTFQATQTGYSVDGIDLGSGNVRPVTAPRILMVIGDGVSSYDAGQVWHMMDTKFGIPMTKVDRSDFEGADLSDYDVVILPSGGYSWIEGETLESLRRWIRSGGTLVALRTAAQWAVNNRLAPNVRAVETKTDSGVPARRDWADADAVRGPQAIGGSIWKADLDVTHPLAFGYHRRELPVWRDHDIFLQPSRSPFGTVARLTEDPHLSGYISDENLERLRGSPSLIADRLGGGTVVLMLDNPNFRGYWMGTNRLLLNAIFFGRYVTAPAAP